MPPPKILIIGNSISGPAFASFLLLSSLPVSEKPEITILEQASSLRKQGQNIDIRGTGVTLIKKLGIEKLVRAAHTGEEGVQWVDSNDYVWAEFAADKTGKSSTPTAEIEILRGQFAEICYRRCKVLSEEVEKGGGKEVEFIFGDRVDELEQDGDVVNVRFKRSGERRSFDLVVAADGLQSSTRKMVFGAEGEEERLKRLDMYAGFFSIPRVEIDTSWRKWFHTDRRRGIMLRPDKQNGRMTVFMYVINDEDGRLVEAATRDSGGIEKQKMLLEEYYQGAGWECERILREMRATDDFYYDMVGQVKMDRWSKGRVVLLGDAGYCASPISGMGTTLALNGAYNLAGALTRHPKDYTAAFNEYEEKMRPLVTGAQKLAPGMPRTFNPETAWGVWIMHNIVSFICWSQIRTVLIKYFGPPANAVTVDEHGFREPPELEE